MTLRGEAHVASGENRYLDVDRSLTSEDVHRSVTIEHARLRHTSAFPAMMIGRNRHWVFAIEATPNRAAR
jgi:hypothetical protein